MPGLAACPPHCPENCLGFRARPTPIFGGCQPCWLEAVAVWELSSSGGMDCGSLVVRSFSGVFSLLHSISITSMCLDISLWGEGAALQDPRALGLAAGLKQPRILCQELNTILAPRLPKEAGSWGGTGKSLGTAQQCLLSQCQSHCSAFPPFRGATCSCCSTALRETLTGQSAERGNHPPPALERSPTGRDTAQSWNCSWWVLRAPEPHEFL